VRGRFLRTGLLVSELIVDAAAVGGQALSRSVSGGCHATRCQAGRPTRVQTPTSYLAGLHLRGAMIWIKDLAKCTKARSLSDGTA
jgi:hypothetical protein